MKEMRRKDREMPRLADIAELLSRCDTVRLGLAGDEYPYVVPLSFGYETVEDKLVIYVHGGLKGDKHERICRDDRVCVEADLCHRFLAGKNGVTCAFESMIGFGHARVVGGEEAAHGLALVLQHCGYENFPYPPAILKVTTVYRIQLEEVNGKRYLPVE